MHCQTGSPKYPHELEIFNTQQQQAFREKTGIFRFDGELNRQCEATG
jgi:hypothetical protein